ncbi:MAG TPA: hypothetical protein VID93_08145 [Acidimicrobiales bacterium]
MTVLVLAHAAPGFDAVGLSPGLVLYLTAAGVALATLALRARPVTADPVDGEDRWPGDELPGVVRAGLGGLGVAALVATLVCAWFGSDLLGDNPVTVTVFSLFWIGGLLLSAVLGDVWRLVDPFDHLAGLLPRRSRPPAGPDLWWLPALLLATFGWTWLAWPDGLRPRSIGWWLAAYTAVMVVGALVGGRAWVRRHEAFGVAFGLVALVSPIDWTGPRPRLRNPLAALGSRTLDERQGAVLAVLVGTALFDAVSYTQWWADFLGVRSLGGYTAFNTLGLAWLVATAAIVWIAVARVAGVVAGQSTALGLRLVAPGVALAAGYATAHEIGSLLNDLRVFALQVTDPLSRGWDLFGTGSWRAEAVVSPTVQAWLSLALLETGVFMALAGFHRRAVARFGPLLGARAFWILAVFVLAAALIGLKLMVGV